MRWCRVLRKIILKVKFSVILGPISHNASMLLKIWYYYDILTDYFGNNFRLTCDSHRVFWPAFSRIRPLHLPVFSRNVGKLRTSVTPNTDTFHIASSYFWIILTVTCIFYFALLIILVQYWDCKLHVQS